MTSSQKIVIHVAHKRGLHVHVSSSKEEFAGCAHQEVQFVCEYLTDSLGGCHWAQSFLVLEKVEVLRGQNVKRDWLNTFTPRIPRDVVSVYISCFQRFAAHPLFFRAITIAKKLPKRKVEHPSDQGLPSFCRYQSCQRTLDASWSPGLVSSSIPLLGK